MNPSINSSLLERIQVSLDSISLPQHEDNSKSAKGSISVNNIHPPSYVMPDNVDLEREWIFCVKCQRTHPQIIKKAKNPNTVRAKSSRLKPQAEKVWDEFTPSFLKM